MTRSLTQTSSMNNKIFTFTIALLFSGIAAFGQIDPPPMAMPNEKNTLLIDKIMEATKYEQYFVTYCTRKVKQYAKENHWTANQTDETIKSIQFEDFKSDVYNSYAFYSTEQLKKMLDALVLLNGTAQKGYTMVLMNSMIQNNLDGFIDDIIKGLYIRKK